MTTNIAYNDIKHKPHYEQWGFVFNDLFEQHYKALNNGLTYQSVFKAIVDTIEYFKDKWISSVIDLYAEQALQKAWTPSPFTFGDLIGGVVDVVSDTLGGFWGLFKGFGDFIAEIGKGVYNAVKDNLQIAMIAMTMLAPQFSPILGGIFRGMPFYDGISNLYQNVKYHALSAYNALGQTVEEAQKVLNTTAIRQLVRIAEDTHLIAKAISPQYRNYIVDVENSVRDISLEVLGDATAIHSYVNIAQMLRYDIGSLTDQPMSENEVKYFELLNDTLTMVETNAQKYSKNGGAFFFDFHNRFITPLYTEQTELERERLTILGQTQNMVSVIGEKVEKIDKRFGEYLEETQNILPYDVQQELREFKSGFGDAVVSTIANINVLLDTQIQKYDKEVGSIRTDQIKISQDVEKNKELLAPPQNLEPDKKAIQTKRFVSIIDSLYPMDNQNQQGETDRDKIFTRSIMSIFDE